MRCAFSRDIKKKRIDVNRRPPHLGFTAEAFPDEKLLDADESTTRGLTMLASNRSLETDRSTSVSALDLKMEAVAALRWSNKLLVEDIAVRLPFREWCGQAVTEGEQWLRRSAREGDCYAMESLGLRLISGDGLQKSPEEGLGWLRKAANFGNPIAMARVAECLLDGKPSSESRTEAEEWLRKAIEHGNSQAAITLGTRLITGTGLLADSERGKWLLVKAAQSGSQLAHIKLGVYLLSGRGLAQNREEGLHWLRRIGCMQPAQLQFLNYYLYMKSLVALTRGEARQLAEDAGVLFYESVQQGNIADEMNLAYLIRRGEVRPEPYPSLDALLSRHLQTSHPSALINQALRLAQGVECEIDWKLADILVRKIKAADGILKWWSARSTEGDAEGHLVTGWLVRHQLAFDPERLPLAQRMNLARASGWEAPEWMSLQAS